MYIILIGIIFFEHVKVFYDIGAFYLRIIQTLATGLKLVPNGCSDRILDEFCTH